MKLRRAVWILALALALAACRSVPVPEYMRQVDPVRQLKAPAEESLVVFVRPSFEQSDLAAHVMDDKGQFLGSVVAGAHFSVVRPVGKQQFIVFAGNLADALVADLGAGLVYFVEVTPVMSGPPRFTLKASARGTNLFPFKEVWLEGTAQYRVDAPAARKEMAGETEKRRDKVVSDANDRLRKYAGPDLTEHTLAQTDGHSKVGTPGKLRYATPSPLPVPIVVPGSQRGLPPPPMTTAPVAEGFKPEDYPTPAPGPAPLLVEDGIRRGYAKGTMVRIKLKDGASWIGEVIRENKTELKISIGNSAQVLFFDEMSNIEVIAPPK